MSTAIYLETQTERDEHIQEIERLNSLVEQLESRLAVAEPKAKELDNYKRWAMCSINDLVEEYGPRLRSGEEDEFVVFVDASDPLTIGYMVKDGLVFERSRKLVIRAE